METTSTQELLMCAWIVFARFVFARILFWQTSLPLKRTLKNLLESEIRKDTKPGFKAVTALTGPPFSPARRCSTKSGSFQPRRTYQAKRGLISFKGSAHQPFKGSAHQPFHRSDDYTEQPLEGLLEDAFDRVFHLDAPRSSLVEPSGCFVSR